MSISVMTSVWEHSKQRGGSLLILLALADHANDDGLCWPGLERLAKKSRMSVRQVQRCLEALREAGEIAVEAQAGPHGTNQYTVILAGDKMSRPHLVRGRQKARNRGDISGPGMSPEPSVTVKEPSSIGQPKNGRPHDELFDAIVETCQVDPATAGASVGKVRSALAKASPPYTPADVLAFGKWWWGSKGMRQRPPTLWQLKEQIGVVRSTAASMTAPADVRPWTPIDKVLEERHAK